MHATFRKTCGAYLAAVLAALGIVGGFVVRILFQGLAAAITFVAVLVVVCGVKCMALFRKFGWWAQHALTAGRR